MNDNTTINSVNVQYAQTEGPGIGAFTKVPSHIRSSQNSTEDSKKQNGCQHYGVHCSDPANAATGRCHSLPTLICRPFPHRWRHLTGVNPRGVNKSSNQVGEDWIRRQHRSAVVDKSGEFDCLLVACFNLDGAKRVKQLWQLLYLGGAKGLNNYGNYCIWVEQKG